MGNQLGKYEYEARELYETEKEMSDHGYNVSIIRGIPQNPTFEESKFNDLIENFETRDDDVFICTYVKAGTTWTQQICHLLMHNGEQGETTMYQTCPWLEAITAENLLSEREAPGHTLESLAKHDGRRFFKSHANFQDLPRGKAAGAKVIYVARNPKDTAVSLYNHAKSKPEFGFQGELSDFIELFMAGKVENGNWWNHVLEWWAESLVNDNVLFLKYEDMINDGPTVVKQIADFVGIECDEAMLERTVANSSMDSMRSGKAGVYQGNVRKGGSGGWRKKWNVDESDRFDALHRRYMEGTGLSFDFGNGQIM